MLCFAMFAPQSSLRGRKALFTSGKIDSLDSLIQETLPARIRGFDPLGHEYGRKNCRQGIECALTSFEEINPFIMNRYEATGVAHDSAVDRQKAFFTRKSTYRMSLSALTTCPPLCRIRSTTWTLDGDSKIIGLSRLE